MERPRQVLCKYIDNPFCRPNYFYGIAYRDCVFCACHGDVFQLNDERVKIVEEISWIDFTDTISDYELNKEYFSEKEL